MVGAKFSGLETELPKLTAEKSRARNSENSLRWNQMRARGERAKLGPPPPGKFDL
jgi:hypothetical protein